MPMEVYGATNSVRAAVYHPCEGFTAVSSQGVNSGFVNPSQKNRDPAGPAPAHPMSSCALTIHTIGQHNKVVNGSHNDQGTTIRII
jgi:hypothetical protein